MATSILYQKRGSKKIPLNFPAETISLTSDQFEATDVKAGLEYLDTRLSELQEANAVDDYSYDPAVGGHRGLIPNIPKKNIRFPGQALRVDMSTEPKINELEINVIGPNQNSSTGAVFYKSGYAMGAEHGKRRAIYESAFIRNPNEPGDGVDYKYLAMLENQKQLCAFYTDMGYSSAGLHWFDPNTGVEDQLRLIIHNPVGYASIPLTLGAAQLDISKCKVGALVHINTQEALTMPAIGTWEYFLITGIMNGSSWGISGFYGGHVAGGTVIISDTSSIKLGMARRII